MTDLLTPLKGLTQNFLIYFFLIFIYNQFVTSYIKTSPVRKSIFLGIVFGVIASLGMLLTIELLPGHKIDGRMIVVSIASAYAGPIVGTVCTFIVCICRILLGGAGVTIEIAGILGSCLLGLTFYFFLRSKENTYNPIQLIILGLFCTLQAQFWVLLLLPVDLGLSLLRKVWLIGLSFYPISALCLGTLIQYNQRQNLLKIQLEENIVELKKAQKDLVTREKLAAIGQVTASIAHDLRNPLGVISNTVFFLKMKLKSQQDEKVNNSLKLLENAVKDSTTIIDDLLSFSKNDHLHLSPHNLNNLITSVVDELNIPKIITTTTILFDELPNVYCDPQQISRVLKNLITNAVQAIEDDGTITIQTKVEDKAVSVIISDTGCGIAKSDLPNIFDPLYTKKAKGVGLGLYIVKTLLEKQNSEISVSSTEGQGTEFKITFAAPAI